MRCIKVKRLIELLQKGDPEAILVMEGSDHSYRVPLRSCFATAVLDDGLWQDFDPSEPVSKHFENEGARRINVFIVE